VELKACKVIFCGALIKFGTNMWSLELVKNVPGKTMELPF
jgi:hypothetical protein